MKYFALFNLFFLCLYGNAQNPRKEIYSIIINNYDFTKIIAIEDSTSLGHIDYDEEYLNYIKESLPKLKAETLNSFINNNQLKINLTKDNFETDKEIFFISNEESTKIFVKGNGWLEFYEKYGKTQGILTISNIGFSNDFTQALIYRGNQRDWKAGSGYLILFQKINNNWEISEFIEIWIS